MTETPEQPEGQAEDEGLTPAQQMDDQERAKSGDALEPIDRDNPEEPTPPKEPSDEGDDEEPAE
jgi:hypothetical protein